MDEQERGLCPTGPPSNMSKMGLYVLLHFFPFSWGEADEERDEVGRSGDEIGKGRDWIHFSGRPVQFGASR